MINKYILCAVLVGAAPLCGSTIEATPNPIVTNPNIVGALNYLSGSFLQQFLEFLFRRLSPLPYEEQARIMSALVMTSERETLRQDEFEGKTIDILARMRFDDTHKIASRIVYEPGATKIANSQAGNLRADLRKNGIHSYVIAPYIGQSLNFKVMQALNHPEYDRYRR